MRVGKKFSGMLIFAILIAMVLYGTVVAYMFRQTEYKDNQFIPASVSCEVTEEVTDNSKTGIWVKNTGNINAYLRVKLISYWVDETGAIMPKASEVPVLALGQDWIAGDNGTYYYIKPVKPEDSTENLIQSSVELKKDTDGNMQVIEVFAEAIQAEPMKAVVTSWNVTLKDKGIITNAKQMD